MHNYAGPGNHFWPLLFESGLVSRPLTFESDALLMDEYGIGFTNLVDRPSASSSDLTLAEMRAGAVPLLRKLVRCTPKVVCFNGRGIYDAFVGRPRKDFTMGLQPPGVSGWDRARGVYRDLSKEDTPVAPPDSDPALSPAVPHLSSFPLPSEVPPEPLFFVMPSTRYLCLMETIN